MSQLYPAQTNLESVCQIRKMVTTPEIYLHVLFSDWRRKKQWGVVVHVCICVCVCMYVAPRASLEERIKAE